MYRVCDDVTYVLRWTQVVTETSNRVRPGRPPTCTSIPHTQEVHKEIPGKSRGKHLSYRGRDGHREHNDAYVVTYMYIAGMINYMSIGTMQPPSMTYMYAKNYTCTERQTMRQARLSYTVCIIAAVQAPLPPVR